MLEVVLCDDSEIVIDIEKRMLQEIAIQNDLLINITSFYNGMDLLSNIKERIKSIDIIFLDVLMEGKDGIETAKDIRNLGYFNPIVFLSNSEKHVFDSFEIRPFNYLLKDDVTFGRFQQVFFDAIKSINVKRNDDICIKQYGGIKFVSLKDVHYFHVKGRIMTIYCDNQIYEFYQKIDELEKVLRNRVQFKRVHRSYIVNLDQLQSAYKDELILKNGEIIPVGVSYQKEVEQLLKEIFFLKNKK